MECEGWSPRATGESRLWGRRMNGGGGDGMGMTVAEGDRRIAAVCCQNELLVNSTLGDTPEEDNEYMY